MSNLMRLFVFVLSVAIVPNPTFSEESPSGGDAVSPSSSAPAPDSSRPAKPNIVFFLADDLGPFDQSINGSTYYETPNIDRIGRQGVRFSQAYSGCCVCSPSRACIQLGMSSARHGITTYLGDPSGPKWHRNTPLLPANYQRNIPSDSVTIGSALQQRGYKTFYVGKWHIGGKRPPENYGYNVCVGTQMGPGSYFPPFPAGNQLDDCVPGEVRPLAYGRKTAEFIESHVSQQPNQPFFAFVAFHCVHSPLQSTEALYNKYKNKLPEGYNPSAKERFVFDRRLPVRQLQDNPTYAGLNESMDQGVGIVLQKLEQLKLMDNTIIIFTSDNGGVSSGDYYSTSNLPLRGGKGRQWEGGTRVPLHICGPAVEGNGRIIDTPVVGMDFYRTLLDLSEGAEGNYKKTGPWGSDGLSFAPLLWGKKPSKKLVNRDLYWHFPHYGNQGGEPSSLIRSGTWKLIHYWENGSDELYDLRSDIGEQTNVLDKNPEVAQALRAKLDKWLRRTHALIPEPNPNFNSEKFNLGLERSRGEFMEELNKIKGMPYWRLENE